MNRRSFLALAGATFAPIAEPLRAQPKNQVIGLLSGTDREPSQIFAIEQGLKEAGFVVGRDVDIDSRWAEGKFDRLPAMADELVVRKVAVILAMQSPRAPLAAKDATSTIPIAFRSVAIRCASDSLRALRGPAAMSPAPLSL